MILCSVTKVELLVIVASSLSGEWSSAGDSEHQPEPRNGHSLTAVGHKLILFGGRGADGRKLSDIHVYDMKTKVRRESVARTQCI